MKPGTPCPDWDGVHPVARGKFQALADDLVHGHRLGMTPTLFRPFELYRSIERQRELLKKGTTKAPPWSSAHQFGLAVDFVKYNGGRWSWADADWDFLRKCAHARGLINDLPWDRPHVQHPLFDRVRVVLAPTISGTLP